MTRLGVGLPALLVLAGCASIDQVAPVPVGTDFQPAAPCVATLKVPQIVRTNPAVFTDAVWERRTTWESQMRFRVDDEGVPREVRADVRGVDANGDVLERSAAAALEGYRFCSHTGLSPTTQWTARMRFTWSPVADKVGGGQMVVQLFLPAYTRDDLSSRRAGTNRVQGTFGQDGRPTAVRLAASSGDPVLDRKSVEAMASYQLVFRPGTVLTRPLTFEQPYTYEIR